MISFSIVAKRVWDCPCYAIFLLWLIMGTVGTPALYAQKHNEGYMMHENAEGQQILYYFHIIEDSTVIIREGLADTGPTVAMPPLLFRQLHAQLEQMSPIDSTQLKSLSLSYEDDFLFFTLAREVDLSWLIGTILFLAGFSGFLVFWFRRRLGQAKQREAELIESRKRLSESREEERLRLARELHDGPIQDLHAVRMQLNMLPSPALLKEPGNGSMENVKDEMLHVIHELRSISENLRPPSLGPFGLAAALKAHVERFKKQHPHIEVEMTLAEDAQTLPERVRLVLFRICQESLNNAAQHARPQHLSVLFELSQEEVLLEIRDDGTGFDIPKEWIHFSQKGHYGLLGMTERAEAIGAHLTVKSRPGQGTLVRLAAPYHTREWHTTPMIAV